MILSTTMIPQIITQNRMTEGKFPDQRIPKKKLWIFGKEMIFWVANLELF